MEDYILTEILYSALNKNWEPLELYLNTAEPLKEKLKYAHIETEITHPSEIQIKANALMIAAKQGTLETLKLLLTNGTGSDPFHHEALIYTIYFNQYEADINYQNEMGYTALTYALRQGNNKMTRIFTHCFTKLNKLL